MRYLFLSLLLLAMAASLSAQEPQITPETSVNARILHQWLESGDPRLIARAATFARQTHDAETIVEISKLLEHGAVPQVVAEGDSQASQKRAIYAVLDTLIQENAHVSAPTISSIAESYPAQAAVLISRLPLSESRQTLEDWTYGATGTWSGRTLARVASMMLAKDPGPSRGMWEGNSVGFVASVVAASEQESRIMIRATGNVGVVNSISCYGVSRGHEFPPGWPQIYSYFLSEDDSQAGPHIGVDLIVVDLDGDRIAFTRVLKKDGGSESYSGIKGLDSSTRHRLIGYWLGVKDNQVPWHPVENFPIVWTNKKAYEQQLREITERQREKLQDTVQTLRKRGLLTEGEAAMVLPKLVISIKCEIDPCPLI